MNLTGYLNASIKQIVWKAFFVSITNAKERRFLIRAAAAQKAAARKRLRSQREGGSIPPFLIASIATQCNLHCSGCYARANHACTDTAAGEELSAARWGELFDQAEELGISFLLLAGGEPFERPDVLNEAVKRHKLIFPVFTNGTLFTEKILEQIDQNRNLIPVVSVEGDSIQTDARRGQGTYEIILRAMKKMKNRGIFFGVSITVTRQNFDTVASAEFIAALSKNGCGLILYVEYVPVDGRNDLALRETERKILDERKAQLGRRFSGLIFLSFPGDEKQMDGCLAAGRGFFHINAFGGAEACPFSPYGDTNLRHGSIKQALDSELFGKIRGSGLSSENHTGGCVLFEKKKKVEELSRVETPI